MIVNSARLCAGVSVWPPCRRLVRGGQTSLQRRLSRSVIAPVGLAGAEFARNDSGRLAFLRPWLTAWYRMCGSARDGVAVAAYAQGLGGRDGVSLAGVEELAAEPTVLVQVAAGTSIRPLCVTR